MIFGAARADELKQSARRRYLSAGATFLSAALAFGAAGAFAANETYTYDSAGRLITVDHGDGRTTTYTLDPAGNRNNVRTELAGSPGSLNIATSSGTYLESQGTVSVALRRAGGVTGTVSVNVATSFTGSANSSDASVSPASVTWASGDGDDKSVVVTIVNDTAIEPAETFNLVISSPTGAATLVSPTSITFTITDNDQTEQTPPTAPTNLVANAISGAQINLTWTASTDASGISQYRIERCTGSGCSNYAQIATSTTNSYDNVGLPEVTPYSYQIRAVDGVNIVGPYSNIASATTRDVTGPSAPGSFAANVASATRIDLSWTASTDNVGAQGYRVERCTGSSCTTYAQIGTTGAGTLAYSDTTTAQLTTYRYRVYAIDAVPNAGAYSAVVSASTADGTAPSVPGGLGASVISPNRIDLTWNAATDNVAVTGYKVYRNGLPAAQVTTTSYSDQVLNPSTTYSFQVSAIDAANNESGLTAAVQATTQPLPDTTPPSTPAGLSGSAPASGQVNLTWGASTDTGGSGLSGYRIYRGGSEIGTAPVSITPSFSDFGTSGTTPYSYTVRAYDNATNLSAVSNTYSVTTPDTIPPPAPTGLTATAVNGSTVNLSWNAGTDLGGGTISSYRVFRNGANLDWVFSGTTLTDATAASGTSYTYTVTARDSSHNESVQSSGVNVTTPNILAASVNSTSWAYVSVNNLPPTISPNVVVTATGGSGGYTYLWQWVSGDTQTNAAGPTNNSTGFNRTLGSTSAIYTSIWRCRVTDSSGAIAYTPNVTVEFERDTGD